MQPTRQFTKADQQKIFKCEEEFTCCYSKLLCPQKGFLLTALADVMPNFGIGIQPRTTQAFWTAWRENKALQNGMYQRCHTETPDPASKNSWEHTTNIKRASWCSICTARFKAEPFSSHKSMVLSFYRCPRSLLEYFDYTTSFLSSK